MTRIHSIQEVVATQLCTGCGVCVFLDDDLEMTNVLDVGARPISRSGRVSSDERVLSACPGVRLVHDETSFPDGIIEELRSEWGPVLEVWEGYASDDEIRFAGSSGGAATALALHAVERRGAAGVIHIGADPDRPILNATRYSTSRAELLEGAGSRYAPASPGEGLGVVASGDGPVVFIGKPCDAAGVRAASKVRTDLDERLALVIGFFCAGTPSTRATLELINRTGVDHEELRSLRYRGHGWPGDWSADDGHARATLTYAESWGFLQEHRQWRCYICPDHTGEFADVAVGDPWYRVPEAGEHGRSLIVARTERGRRAVLEAQAAGYLTLERSDPALLPASQHNLARTRGRLWGQLLALRLARAPVPTYRGMPTFRAWLRVLPLRDKATSLLGTFRRIRRKSLKSRLDIESMERVGR